MPSRPHTPRQAHGIACFSGERAIVAKWDSTGSNCSYRLYLDDGVPELQLSNDGSAVYTFVGTKAVLADGWGIPESTQPAPRSMLMWWMGMVSR